MIKKLYPHSSILYLLVLSILLIVGCAKPIPPENMVPTQLGKEYLIYSGPLYKAISVGKVGGGKETNPAMFADIGDLELEKAIIKSLETSNYYALSKANTKYTLDVFLVEIARPSVGITSTVTIFVRYKITDIKDNNVVLDEIINASDTKKVSEIFVGVTRSRVAKEESMKKNITKFLAMLFSLNEEISSTN